MLTLTHTHTHTQQQQQQEEEDLSASGRTEGGLSTDTGISRPTPERRAARRAVERLSEITKDLGVQVSPSSEEAAMASTSRDDPTLAVYGFTHDEMNVFRLTIEHERLIECPAEVCNVYRASLKMKWIACS